MPTVLSISRKNTPYRMSMAETTGGLCRCSVIQSSRGRPMTALGTMATSTWNHMSHTSLRQ